MRLIANRVNLFLLLLVAVSVLVLLLGARPKPCPRHICLPADEIVTAEEYLAQRAAAARQAASPNDKVR